jgi:hypothetical protein
MATVKVYNDTNGRYYNIFFELKNSYLSDGDGTSTTFLVARTDIKKHDGTSFTPFNIFDLTNLPPDGDPTPVTDFSGLCKRYVKYFQTAAAFTMSSSSSSSEEYSSSSSEEYSSSSSSEGKSSSSSSSSSSEEYSSESSLLNPGHGV